MTLLSNRFYPGFHYFFGANYCVIVTIILVDAAAGYGLPPSQSFIFYSRHPDVCTAIIIIIIIIVDQLMFLNLD